MDDDFVVPFGKKNTRARYYGGQTLGGGFNYFLFLPLPGEMIQFDSYFSNGLKPPTRMARPHFFLVYFDPTSYYMVRLNRPVRRSTSRWAIEQILGSLRYVGAFRIIPMFYRDYNKELYIRISIKQLKWPFDHPNGGQKTTSGSRIKLLTKVPEKNLEIDPKVANDQKNGENPTNKWWKSYQQMVKILPKNGCKSYL